MEHDNFGFWRWTFACGIAEFLGIALAALWWILVDRLDPQPIALPSRLLMLALKGGSGIIEGAILGVAQASVLCRRYPALSRRRWTVATAIFASVGWLIGSAPSIFIVPAGTDPGPAFEPSLPEVSLFAAIFGLAVGAAFGGAQWLVLRHAAWRSGRWIVANMVGWMVALPVIYIAASSGSGVAPIPEVILRGLVSGLAAGLILGALLYPFILRMPPR